MKLLCHERFLPIQVDTFRSLLEEKEIRLRSIMLAARQKEAFDADVTKRLPTMADHAVKIRTVKRKKKGLAGLFGGKKQCK